MEINMDPKQKQMLDDVFDAFTILANGGFVSLMHVQGNMTRYSKAAVELFGLSGEYIENGSMDWTEWVHPDDRQRYLEAMAPMVTGDSMAYDLTYRTRTVNDGYVNFRYTGAVLRDEEGNPSLIGGLIQNQGQTENTDPVTVLRNQNGYLTDLSERINNRQRVVSLLCGISRLTEINRTSGYTYGNRILQEIAWLIQDTVKGRGVVYRMEDATFAVLSETLSREELSAIYDTLRIKLQRGISVDGVRNILTANGGLISTQEETADAESVYACLKYAYRESKLRNHGELVDYNGSINYESTRSIELLNRIRDSILEDCRGFSLRYVPVLDVATEKFMGAEAVIYWEDEEYGLVGPEDFVPVLERDFVFEELGDFILQKALFDGAQFLKKDPDFQLCINISPVQLEDDYFIDNVLLYLKEAGFPASCLSFKLTRDCRLMGMERLHTIVTGLQKAGIITIIDNFGTGFDSIRFLKELPIAGVCFDKGLIEGIEENEEDRHMLEYLAKMVATRVRHINATGVNTETMHKIIKNCPITTMQGPYASDPLTAEALDEKYL